ncbi:unnamed protein product [Symbiodinium sp. CCMP2456]|nr:unnamed protein product [Symbiodinium sp. CCMP2456]
MARILSAWEAAKLHLEVSEKNRAEARFGTQQRLLQPSEQHGVRVAVEAVLGKLKDKEVASLEDSELETYSAVIDPMTNVLKVKPGKTLTALTSLPQTPEELRLRHRRIGLSWDFLATKHSSRSWLSKNLTDTLRRFSDYILGVQVAGLQTGDGRKPTWSLVLQFEHEARKAAYKWLRDGKVATLDAAFSRAMVDTEVLQRHLIIPFSLNVSAKQQDDMPNSWVERPPRGGRGRGRATGRGTGGKGFAIKSSRTTTQILWSPRGSSLRMPMVSLFAGATTGREAALMSSAVSNMFVSAVFQAPMPTTIAPWSSAPRGATDSMLQMLSMVLVVRARSEFRLCKVGNPTLLKKAEQVPKNESAAEDCGKTRGRLTQAAAAEARFSQRLPVLLGRPSIGLRNISSERPHAALVRFHHVIAAGIKSHGA